MCIQVDNPCFVVATRSIKVDAKKSQPISIQFKSDRSQGARLTVTAPKVTNELEGMLSVVVWVSASACVCCVWRVHGVYVCVMCCVCWSVGVLVCWCVRVVSWDVEGMVLEQASRCASVASVRTVGVRISFVFARVSHVFDVFQFSVRRMANPMVIAANRRHQMNMRRRRPVGMRSGRPPSPLPKPPDGPGTFVVTLDISAVDEVVATDVAGNEVCRVPLEEECTLSHVRALATPPGGHGNVALVTVHGRLLEPVEDGRRIRDVLARGGSTGGATDHEKRGKQGCSCDIS